MFALLRERTTLVVTSADFDFLFTDRDKPANEIQDGRVLIRNGPVVMCTDYEASVSSRQQREHVVDIRFAIGDVNAGKPIASRLLDVFDLLLPPQRFAVLRMLAIHVVLPRA